MGKQSKYRKLLYALPKAMVSPAMTSMRRLQTSRRKYRNTYVSASATDKSVKIEIIQATSVSGTAIVKFDYKGVVKTYKVVFKTTENK